MTKRDNDYLTDSDVWLIAHYLEYAQRQGFFIVTKGIIAAIGKNPEDKRLQNEIAELLRFWGWTKKRKRMVKSKYVREWITTLNPYVRSKEHGK